MPNKATITAKTGPAVAVTSFVINNPRGYSVDFNAYQLTVTKENGAVETFDLSTGAVTLTTAVAFSTGINSVTLSVA